MKNFFVSLWKGHKPIILAAAVIAALYSLMFTLGITCPIRHITGISCPGCGMTRALFCALCGNIKGAFYYHPLWIALIVGAILLIVLAIKRKRTLIVFTLISLGVIFAAVYLYRLFFVSQDVVVFSPDDGAIARALGLLAGLF